MGASGRVPITSKASKPASVFQRQRAYVMRDQMRGYGDGETVYAGFMFGFPIGLFPDSHAGCVDKAQRSKKELFPLGIP